jgi:pimeloyl-ACP methyl ester carboxylesterase
MAATISQPPPKTITLRDGRVLAYAEYGPETGRPVFGFHGMPGSRYMMKTLEPAALALGVRLIAPERPGYGLSQPDPGADLLAYPGDIAELAQQLKLERFAVLGVSGGGPYALACAAALPQQLSVAAVVSGIGSLRLKGSTHGMQSMNRILFTLGHFSPGLTGLLLPVLLRSSLPSMEAHIRNGTSPVADLSPAVFAIMATDQREAIRGGGRGVSYDMRMLWQPWGFQLEDIRTKVFLWHGEADTLAPAALAHRIAECIPGCEATFYFGEDHTGPLIKHGQEILAKIAARNQA